MKSTWKEVVVATFEEISRKRPGGRNVLFRNCAMRLHRIKLHLFC